MIEKLLLNLLVGATQNPQIRAFVIELVKEAAGTIADKLTPDLVGELLPKLSALLPVFGGGVVTEVLKRLGVDNLELGQVTQDVAKNILDSDPDIPILSDILDLSEIMRKFFS